MLHQMLSLPQPMAGQPQGRAYQRELAAALDDARVKVSGTGESRLEQQQRGAGAGAAAAASASGG